MNVAPMDKKGNHTVIKFISQEIIPHQLEWEWVTNPRRKTTTRALL